MGEMAQDRVALLVRRNRDEHAIGRGEHRRDLGARLRSVEGKRADAFARERRDPLGRGDGPAHLAEALAMAPDELRSAVAEPEREEVHATDPFSLDQRRPWRGSDTERACGTVSVRGGEVDLSWAAVPPSPGRTCG